jgi:hypothetical protein
VQLATGVSARHYLDLSSRVVVNLGACMQTEILVGASTSGGNKENLLKERQLLLRLEQVNNLLNSSIDSKLLRSPNQAKEPDEVLWCISLNLIRTKFMFAACYFCNSHYG